MSRRDHYQQQWGKGASRWPDFTDGDVKIVLTGSRQYQLHSNILKFASKNGLMTLLLGDDNAARLSSKAIKRGAVTRYRLVGNINHNQREGGIDVMLEPVNLDSDGRPIDGQAAPLDLENGRVIPPVYDAYEKVLGAVYGRQIELGEFDSSKLGDMLQTAMGIIEVAEYLGMINNLTKPFEAALLAKNQLLHRSIAANPATWLDFAFRIRSRVIFREALIHAAGQMNTPAMKTATETMREEIYNVLVRKGKIITEGVRTATKKMLSYYPPQLRRELTVGYADHDKIGRGSYSNDIFIWIALTAFRQFLADNAVADETHNAKDMGYSFIAVIKSGNYLNKEALEDFHLHFPMTPKGKSVLMDWILQGKEVVKKWTPRLLENRSLLDTTRFPSGYFTNTIVNPEDYPWTNEV